MPQSARSSIISLDTNESLGHSPCPGKRTRNSLRRYSHLAQSEMGQLQIQPTARPLAPRHQSQRSIDSTSGSSDDHHPLYRLKTKTSQRTSLLTISSVGSSPCPRPANKRVPMLTGNRLPRPGPHLTARGGFGDQGTDSDTTSGELDLQGIRSRLTSYQDLPLATSGLCLRLSRSSSKSPALSCCRR